MSALLERIKKNSTIKDSSILSSSKFFTKKDMVTTPIPALNIALSGRIDGGLTPGLTLFCGPSKHFKSLFSLILAKSYMDKYPESVLVFYDCEFGTPESYFDSLGIDKERVVHTPIMNMEEFKFDIMHQLQEIKRGDKVIFVIDSLGNMSSKKEMEDAIAGKSTQDMSRAKQMKSIFRMITPYLVKYDIPMVAVNHILSLIHI
jgi:RecA/RadA recombinase